jgi:anhydro-N-acetylmuramic acid kinase
LVVLQIFLLEVKVKMKVKVIAYDVCAANTVLNYLAKQKGLDYDKDGNLARNGIIIPDLLMNLNEINFCKQAAPKSLGTNIFTKIGFRYLINTKYH